LTAIKRFGIFGGTFDPIHLGHVHLLKKLLATKLFDEVVVIPAGNPWQKQPRVSAQDRLEMTRLALNELPIQISEIEINRDTPSFALETVLELKNINGANRYTWIIGSDALNNISTWYEIEHLAQEVDFLVINRPNAKTDASNIPSFVNFTEIEIDALDISATQVRTALANHDDVSGLIPDTVARFIQSKGLYGAA
jgi:nicotinate-nucleotide adenylyltransferase